MPSITYRFSWSHNRHELTAALVLLCVLFGFVVILLAMALAWPFMTSSTAEADRSISYLALGSIPLWGCLVVLQYLQSSPRHNLLNLDDDGLTYTRLGKSHRWRWSDIAGFRPRKRWLDLFAVEFVSPFDVGWAFRVPPWLFWRPGAAAKIVMLPDVFDAPLGEIAAKLEEYRERALGAGAGPAGRAR